MLFEACSKTGSFFFIPLKKVGLGFGEILFLLLGTSAWACLQHSRNL